MGMIQPRENFIAAAEAENWSWIDENLRDQNISVDDIRWVMEVAGTFGQGSNNYRDLAATYLVVSNRKLDAEETKRVLTWMRGDSYYIVVYRLAIALYKRGVRDKDVELFFGQALKDKDVGTVAAKYQKAA